MPKIKIEIEITVQLYDDFQSFRTRGGKGKLSKTKAARALVRESLRKYQGADEDLKKKVVEFTEHFLSAFRESDKENLKIVYSSIERDLHRQIDDFVTDYNKRSNSINTKREAYASLLQLSIDPNKPWPND